MVAAQTIFRLIIVAIAFTLILNPQLEQLNKIINENENETT